MACKRGNATAKSSVKRTVETNDRLKELLPKTTEGIEIYDLDRVRNFLYGATFQGDQAIGKILLEGEPGSIGQTGAFSEVLGRLFSADEVNSLLQGMQEEMPKETFLDPKQGKYISYKDASLYQLATHLHIQFFEYNARGGVANPSYTLAQKNLFRFANQWFSDINENAIVYNSTVVGSAGAILNTTFSKGANTLIKQSGLTPSQLFYINEGIAASLFRVLETRPESLLEIVDAFENNPGLIDVFYGDPSLKIEDTIYDDIMQYLMEEYSSVANDWIWSAENNGEDHPRTLLLQKEYEALDELVNIIEAEDASGMLTYSTSTPGIIGQNWKALIKQSKEYLTKFDIYTETKEDTREDESNVIEDDEDATRDKLSILSEHKTNPLKRMKGGVKLLLRTLPSVSHVKSGGSGTFVYNRNRLGMPQLEDFGTVFSTLYKITANSANELDLIQRIEMLAAQDRTYQVLLNRLGLPNGVDSIHTLDKYQFDLLMDLYSSMNNAENSYEMMYITQAGGRGLIDANKDSASNIVKSKWAENFKNTVRRSYGKVESVNNSIVLDFNKNYTFGGFNTTVKERLEKGAQSLEDGLIIIRDLLGIEFTNQDKVIDDLFDKGATNEVLANINSLLLYLSKNETSNLFDTDQKGRLNLLVDLELQTNIKTGSLQINSPGGKIYSITKKGYINVIVDELNVPKSPALAELEKSPTLIGSVYAKALKEGVKLKVGVILGANESLYGTNKDYSKMSANDLSVLQVNQAIEGKVAVIRTGNKKLEKTLYLDQPSDLTFNTSLMAKRMSQYLLSEIVTANKIIHGAASSIKGMKDGATLQYFKDESFSELHNQATMFINQTNLDEQELANWVSNPNTLASLVKVITADIAETLSELIELNVLATVTEGERYINIGIHDNHLISINKENKLNGIIEKNIIDHKLAEKIAALVYFQRTTSHIEQFKLILGHPAAFGKNLLKRTSGFVGPKTMPAASEQVLTLLDKYYPNKGNPLRLRDGKVRMMTREEPLRTSKYLNDYISILEHMGRGDLIESLTDAYTDMEITDGGGFVHIDFYILYHRNPFF